jgi:hypothetical protein
MPRCILHLGMPKTGSTSIQETLYHGLRVPGFRYVSFGEVNGEGILLTCFSQDYGENYHYHQKLGLSRNQLARVRASLLSRLDILVERSRQRRETLILSGESAWAMSRNEFASIRDYFAQRGYTIDVYVYLRFWTRWLESNFQERIKQGETRFEVLPASRQRYVEYSGQLQALDAVFERDHVFPAWFAPQAFPQRCVVLDFCGRAGIPLPARFVRRQNDGISMDALKLLLAYRRRNQGYGVGLKTVIQNEILFRRLREVGGPPVRFHSSLFAPVQHAWMGQIPVVERRVGPLPWDEADREDTGECLREESQLKEFSRPSLDWLSKASGGGRIVAVSGLETEREVSEQMRVLRQHPSVTSQFLWHRMILSRRLEQWLRGV